MTPKEVIQTYSCHIFCITFVELSLSFPHHRKLEQKGLDFKVKKGD